MLLFWLVVSRSVFCSSKKLIRNSKIGETLVSKLENGYYSSVEEKQFDYRTSTKVLTAMVMKHNHSLGMSFLRAIERLMVPHVCRRLVLCLQQRPRQTLDGHHAESRRPFPSRSYSTSSDMAFLRSKFAKRPRNYIYIDLVVVTRFPSISSCQSFSAKAFLTRQHPCPSSLLEASPCQQRLSVS